MKWSLMKGALLKEGINRITNEGIRSERGFVRVRGSQMRVRAALSSSGFLLLRLSSSVLAIRRSRADSLGPREPVPCTSLLQHALHSRGEPLCIAREKSSSGAWLTGKKEAGRLNRDAIAGRTTTRLDLRLLFSLFRAHFVRIN